MSDGMKQNNTSSSENTFDLILKASMKLPGIHIDRTKFLQNQLSKHCSPEEVLAAIESTPAIAGIPIATINKIASSSINWEAAQVSALSFVAGIPGGLIMAGTIPADIAQYFYNTIQLVQKLSYLYGWPDDFNKENFDDETKMRITLFIGVMFGAAQANQALGILARALAQQITKRLPKVALTKFAIYNISKQVAKWIGVTLTKEVFAKQVGKAIPIIGGIVGGAISYSLMHSTGKKLKDYLCTLPLATGEVGDDEAAASSDENIEAEYTVSDEE